MKFSGAIDFNALALNYARKDFPLLEADASVGNALESIRRESVDELKLHPEIANGRVTLALADMFALVFYFTRAWLVLR